MPAKEASYVKDCELCKSPFWGNCVFVMICMWHRGLAMLFYIDVVYGIMVYCFEDV